MFTVFKKWKAEVQKETSLKLKCLRSDNSGEDNRILSLKKTTGMVNPSHMLVKVVSTNIGYFNVSIRFQN